MSNDYFERIAQIESGGNPLAKNPNSSAKGKYQFIDSTAKQYGITAEFGTPEYTAQEEQAIRQFTKDNYNALSKGLNREPTQGELYLAHQQGAGGALKLLTSQDKAVNIVGRDAIKLNRGNENMTGQQFAQQWTSKLDGQGNIAGNQGTNNLVGGQGSDNVTPARRIKLPDGRNIVLTGQETPEQIKALKEKLRTKYQAQPVKEQEKQGFIKNLALDGKNFVKSTAYSLPLGFGDELRDGVAAVTAGALSKDLSIPEAYKLAREQTTQEQTQMRKDSPVASIAGDLTGAVLTGGAVAGTKAGTSLANSLRAGNPLARIVKGGAIGAASGTVYGAGTAESGNRIAGAKQGAIFGAVGGAAIPAIASAGSGLKSTLSPQIEKATASLAKRAKEFDIPLRLDQISPTRARNTVQKVSQEIPFSGADAFEETQRKAFTKAVAKTIGQNADDLSPETIKNFTKEASKKFDDHLKGEVIKVGNKTIKSLDDIVTDADLTIDDGLVKVVRNNIEKLKAQLAGGEIDGNKISSIRSELLKRSTKAQGGAREFLSDAIDVIDDAIEKSLSPAKSESLKQVRREWRNYKTIEPLLEESTDGLINPTKLLARVKSSKYIKASSSEVGKDDLVDLARIGKDMLVKKGGSDTFQKGALTGGSIAGGAGLMVNPLGTIATVAGVPLANRGLQKLNTSQRLIDLAVKNSSKTTKALNRPKSPLFIGGSSGGIAAQ